MTHIINVLVLLGLCAFCFAAAVPVPAGEGEPVHQCYVDRFPDIELFLGQSISLKGLCQKVMCLNPNSDDVERISCPIIELTPGCKLVKKPTADYAEYPKCCPDIVCSS